MARPTMRPGVKRRAVSISVHPSTLEAARASGNASQWFERAVRACLILKEMKKRGIVESHIERLERLVAPYAPSSERREGVPTDDPFGEVDP